PAAQPRLDPRDCPGQQNWTEGEQEILECRARGRPRPRLECSKDGDPQNSQNSQNSRDSLPVGIPQRARRAQAGIYRCRAWNELGTAESSVTLWVHREFGGILGFLGFFGDFGVFGILGGF
ncbi:ICAM1 protein, partial [Rhabdornis inornatus]|nr:ICAM1 protein [Rhabdornis inornatus]